MIDYSHLDAIAARLSREKARLASAKNAKERAFRAAQVSQAEKELAAEYKFLGIAPVTIDDLMNDDDLLAELTN